MKSKLFVVPVVAALLTGCGAASVSIKDPDGNDTGYFAAGVEPHVFAPTTTIIFGPDGKPVHISDGKSMVDQLAVPAAMIGGAILLRPDETNVSNNGGDTNVEASATSGSHSSSSASNHVVNSVSSTSTVPSIFTPVKCKDKR